MRAVCVLGFEIDVPEDEVETTLSDLGAKISGASERLGIGYRFHLITGHAQPVAPSEPDPVTLFET